MTWKKIITIASLLFSALSYAEPTINMGQSIQVSGNFSYVLGKPSWLLIIRNTDTGEVFPYLYDDIVPGDNFFMAFSYGRNYQITASVMRFWPFPAKINNFCNLESGPISGQSMYVTINGRLTPNKYNFRCNVRRFKNSF